MTAPDGLARQIREMRVAMKHTQLSLALAIGAHPMSVSKWERGRAVPHLVFFNAIRDLYHAGSIHDPYRIGQKDGAA